MIDILKETTPIAAKPVRKSSSKRNLSVPLAIALAWVVFDTSYWTRFVPDRILPYKESSQVLFVTNESMSRGQGQASVSLLVDKFCETNGIERRRLEVNQETSGAEDWLQEMAEIGYGQAPSVVFRSKSGQLDCIPMPDSVEGAIEEIRSRL